jgi:hypothetical protein
MYPPHISDDTIQTVISELAAAGDDLPSGALLRAVLKQRFGSPGGVTRIYRLLSAARSKKTPPRKEEGAAQTLERELDVMRKRAERAERREEAHQSRWALEVDQLRLKVSTYEPMIQEARKALESVGLLKHQLRAAELRIATLEQQLIEANRRGGQKE